jgi:16S rRNA (cytosine967-C5)-methyltransferase
MSAAPSAREIAARVIERVDRDRAYAAAVLDAELDRYRELDPRERALVYGSLRSRPVLLERLERVAPRGLGKLDPLVRAQLAIAAYQLLVLERVPAHAAVDAAVGSVRRTRGPRLAGFVNAVLRKLAAAGERIERSRAILDSTPGWLWKALTASIGDDEARALIGAGVEGVASASVGLRLRSDDHEPLPEWLAAAAPGRVSPLARLVRGIGDPRKLDGFSQGRFVVQEEGSQLVGLAVGAGHGERVLDACAGRGQKSTLLAERIGPTGELWATDVHPAKLRVLEEELERLRLPPVHVAAVDWTIGAGSVPDGFDRVLVDAPCTGTGTLRRRPEIAGRLQPGDPARLSALAERILRSAALRARPGGRVVFSVCSVLREECDELILRVGDLLEPLALDAPELAPLIEPGATCLRLLPLRHGTDGFFVANFRRR